MWNVRLSHLLQEASRLSTQINRDTFPLVVSRETNAYGVVVCEWQTGWRASGDDKSSRCCRKQTRGLTCDQRTPQHHLQVSGEQHQTHVTCGEDSSAGVIPWVTHRSGLSHYMSEGELKCRMSGSERIRACYWPFARAVSEIVSCDVFFTDFTSKSLILYSTLMLI